MPRLCPLLLWVAPLAAAASESPPLRELADAAGIRLGVAVAWPELGRRPEVARLVAHHFHGITPENALKWAPIEHEPGRRDLAAADALVGWALEHELRVKGHALVWDQEIPAWLVGQEPVALQAALDAHLRSTLDEFGTGVHEWDVVNEALDAQGRLAPSPFVAAFGPGHIDQAFHAARRRLPDALLLYNDYDLSGGGPKTEGLLRLVDGMLAREVPLDGVGIQSHLDITRPPAPEALPALLRALHDRGLVAHISELDVRIGSAGGARWGREAAQAVHVHRVARACIEAPACTALTVWGLYDGDHWTAREGLPREGPVLFNAALQPKPAFHALAAALRGEPAPVCSENIIEHGDLEEGARGWSTGGGVLQRSTAAAHSGAFGLHHDQRTADWQGPVRDLSAHLGAGLDWRVAVQARHDGPTDQPLRLTLRLEDDAGERFVPLAKVVAAPGEWVALEAQWTPELQGPLRRADLYLEGPAAGVALDVDELQAGVVCSAP